MSTFYIVELGACCLDGPRMGHIGFALIDWSSDFVLLGTTSLLGDLLSLSQTAPSLDKHRGNETN